MLSVFANTDIYLLDQIFKARYHYSERILDAGAGGGRNLAWFIHNGFKVYGSDRDPEMINLLQQQYPEVSGDRFVLAPVEKMPFPDDWFDHVICSAVLHFADNHAHFDAMFAELVRVLRPGGSLFIRTITDVGMPDNMTALGGGRFHLTDGSDRYVMRRQHLDELMEKHHLRFLEPFKTVLVDSLRSMAVLVMMNDE